MFATENMDWLLQPPPSYIIAIFTRPSKRGEGGSHYDVFGGQRQQKNVVFFTYSWLRTVVLKMLYTLIFRYVRSHTEDCTVATHDDSLYRMTVPPSCRSTFMTQGC